ncbi:hypothetical protein Hanom_Chr14g01248111 [Helianthus anomalus]
MSHLDEANDECDVQYIDFEVESVASQHVYAEDVVEATVKSPLDVNDVYELTWVLTNRF